jgi:hypothetical protein
MLWSQFSTIFGKKLAFFLNTNIMINFFSKFSFVLSQKCQLFRQIFWRKYLKNHNIDPWSSCSNVCHRQVQALGSTGWQGILIIGIFGRKPELFFYATNPQWAFCIEMAKNLETNVNAIKTRTVRAQCTTYAHLYICSYKMYFVSHQKSFTTYVYTLRPWSSWFGQQYADQVHNVVNEASHAQFAFV